MPCHFSAGRAATRARAAFLQRVAERVPVGVYDDDAAERERAILVEAAALADEEQMHLT